MTGGNRVTFDGTRLIAAFLLVMTAPVIASNPSVGKYYQLIDGTVVQVRGVSSGKIRVEYPDGRMNLVRQANWPGITDYSSVATVVASGLDNEVTDEEHTVSGFKKRLKRLFDDTYVEMMAACLNAEVAFANRPDELKHIVTSSREQELEHLVTACKVYDVEKLIVILRECDFHEGFLDAAIQDQSASRRQSERDRNWLKINASEQEATRQNMAQYDSFIKNCAPSVSSLEDAKASVQDARKAVGLLEEEYHRVYKKSSDVLSQYASIREALARNESISSQAIEVRALANDWCRSLLQPVTLQCAADAHAAFKELQRRRKPQDSVSNGQSSIKHDAYADKTAEESQLSEKNNPPAAKKKRKKGCFIATAVYESYDHPDVLVLRRLRDNTLQDYAWGRMFIAWYYENGPTYAEWIKSRPFLTSLVRLILRGVVLLLLHPLLGCVVIIALAWSGRRGLRTIRAKWKFYRQRRNSYAAT